MRQKLLANKEIIIRISTYVLMLTVMAIMVLLVTMYMLGYRLNFSNRNIQQVAILQFDTNPSGASVTVDGRLLSTKTPTKTSVSEGTHVITMQKDGYQVWSKTVTASSGSLKWLSYAVLMPTNLSVELMTNYPSLVAAKASPDAKYLVLQRKIDTLNFDLVDISGDSIKTTAITVPNSVYTDSSAPNVSHVFAINAWDNAGRYLLISHRYNDATEWLVVDTQNPNLSKNISKTFDVAISKIFFADTSGNDFYALVSGDIRELNLSGGTISKPLVNQVSDFNYYNEGKIITYVGSVIENSLTKKVVGIYRQGDETPIVIKKVNPTVSLKIATTRYFNEDYIALQTDNVVEVLSGSYPTAASDTANNMKLVTTFSTSLPVDNLSFSPSGQYVIARAGANFMVYDLEYQNLSDSLVAGNGDISNLGWLDDNYLWSDRDGKLTIREFDGTNLHVINSVAAGFDVAMTHNGRYIYSIDKSATGYQLQRVRIVLP